MGKKLLIYAIPVAILAAVAWFELRGGTHPVQLGEKVPNFNLAVAANGGDKAADATGDVRLADYHGKVLVLNFWATWCPPCVEETPSLEDFARRVKPLGIEVLGASEDTDSAALAAFVAKYHLTYTIAHDPGRALATRYGTLQFPETYIIDKDGHLAEKIISNTDWDDPRMLAYVRELALPNRAQASN
ncbi:MAG TPA: TlpA disulfide reductase family protein [Terriglobia bacterium]|nr:TlpA disulfide reductase family protein [Terriglobia bacterium]